MEAATARNFHLGDLISVVTGRLVSPNHIRGVYGVCDFVTGEAHMAHQLPRACDTVKPWLLEQHPWLSEIDVPEFDMPSGVSQGDAARIVADWLAGPVARYGETHRIQPMPFGMYVGREPIGELREMAPNAQVIVVDLETGEVS